MRGTYLFIILLHTIHLVGQVSERQLLEQERNEIIARIDQQESLLEKTREDERTAIKQYASLQQQIVDRRTLVKNLAIDSSLIEAEIDSLTIQRQKITSTTRKDQATYKALLKATYIKKLTGIRWLDYLNNESLNETIRKYWYESQLVSRLQQAKAEITDQSVALDDAINRLQNLRSSKVKLSTQAKQALVSIQTDIEALQKLRSTLSQKEQRLQEELDSEQQRRSELNQAIESVVLQNMKSGEEQWSVSVQPKSTYPRSIIKPSADARVVATFGQQSHPRIPDVQINRTGVTLKSSTSPVVLCVYDGMVASIAERSGSSTVIINHGKYYSVYSQLSSTNIVEGSNLRSGDTIGLGTSVDDGWSFDFEWWDGKRAIDPEEWW